MAVWRRMCQLCLGASKSKVSSSSSLFERTRRRLEREGVPLKQAKIVSTATTEVSNDMQKVRSEVSNDMQKGHHFSLLQHETEKLRNDIEKMHIELRYEIDKVIASNQHLKLQMGKIREQLYNQNTKTNNMTNRWFGQLRTGAYHPQKAQIDEGHHFSLLQHETEKLRNDIKKMHIELRYEIDKVIASNQHLKLQMGKIREQLYNQNTKTNNMTNRWFGQLRTGAYHPQKAQIDEMLNSLLDKLFAICLGAFVLFFAGVVVRDARQGWLF